MKALPRGIIFDLFHTLTAKESEWSDLPATCDVLGFERRAWDETLTRGSRWRLAGEERDACAIVRALARSMNPSIPEDLVVEATRIRTLRFREALQRIPAGNLATLRALREHGFKLGLLSNADAMEVAAWAHSPLAGRFDVEIFSCEVGCVKPEPEIFHACLDRLRLRASECMFVGDGGSDELQGAKAVGLRTVFVSGVIEALFPERVPHRAAISDHHIRELPELLALLELPCHAN